MSTHTEVVFILTREDVVNCLYELDLPTVGTMTDAERIVTDDLLQLVKRYVGSGLGCWDEVMKEAILEALRENPELKQKLLLQ